MKILITTDLYTTDTNGVVTSVRNLYEELKAMGHDVRILTLSECSHSHKTEDTYYIRSMPLKIYPDLRMPLTYHHRFIRELVSWCPDIIHSQCEFFTFQFALYIAKHTDAPIVHTYHTMYDEYVTYVIPSKRLGKRLLRAVFRRRLKNVDTIVAPTHKVEDSLHDYKLTNSIRVVPTGISLEKHKGRLSQDERIKKLTELGIPADHTVLISLGRLGYEKNTDELVRFFAKALRKNDKLSFLIVGDGPAKHDLEKLADELDLTGKVIFTGMVNPSEVNSYYQLGDLFVSASTSETQGLTYVEAAANGLPLLCRSDSCLKDVIIEGENGFEYLNENEFLNHLDYIASSPQWRKRAALRSEIISAAFDKSEFGVKIEKIYESVIE